MRRQKFPDLIGEVWVRARNRDKPRSVRRRMLHENCSFVYYTRKWPRKHTRDLPEQFAINAIETVDNLPKDVGIYTA